MKKAIQLVLSGGFLLALGFLVDWKAIVLLLPTLDLWWVLAAACFILLARTCITLRWILLLRVSGYLGKAWHLFLVVSAGIGLGSVLPTSVGPDIARGALLRALPGSNPQVPMTQVLSSLTLDRYTATIGTIVTAMIGCFLIGNWALLGVLLVGLCALIIMTTVFLKFANQAVALITPGILQRFRNKIIGVVAALQIPGMLLRGVAPAIPISALMTMCRVGMFVCLYQAFEHDVPLSWAMVTIPVLLIVLMIPITVGGFGVREWTLVIGFESLGIPAEVSVSVGILSFALQMLVSLPAIAYVSGIRKGKNDVAKNI